VDKRDADRRAQTDTWAGEGSDEQENSTTTRHTKPELLPACFTQGLLLVGSPLFSDICLHFIGCRGVLHDTEGSLPSCEAVLCVLRRVLPANNAKFVGMISWGNHKPPAPGAHRARCAGVTQGGAGMYSFLSPIGSLFAGDNAVLLFE